MSPLGESPSIFPYLFPTRENWVKMTPSIFPTFRWPYFPLFGGYISHFWAPYKTLFPLFSGHISHFSKTGNPLKGFAAALFFPTSLRIYPLFARFFPSFKPSFTRFSHDFPSYKWELVGIGGDFPTFLWEFFRLFQAVFPLLSRDFPTFYGG